MKLSQNLEAVLNDQLNMELASSFSYLGMAAWFETTPYDGFAAWMISQSEEEKAHAMKFYDYLLSRGNHIKLTGLKAPKMTYSSPLEAFQTSLKQEQEVSASIRNIYSVATEEKDFETLNFLNWFLAEQIEEEESVGSIVEKLELVGDHANGLLRLSDHSKMREE